MAGQNVVPSGPAPEGPTTVADLLALTVQDSNAAATFLYGCANGVAVAVCRRQGIPGRAGDLAGDLYTRAVTEDWAALRRADPDAPVRAWIRVALTNIAREMHRDERRAYGTERSDRSEEGDTSESDSAGRAAAARSNAIDSVGSSEVLETDGLLGRMTPELWAALTAKQAAAFRACDGSPNAAAIARQLRISRAAVRDRLRRGIRRVRAKLAGADPPDDTRRLLPAGQSSDGHPLTPEEELVRRRWNAGARLRKIAAEIGRTPEATRSLVRRLRCRLER